MLEWYWMFGYVWIIKPSFRISCSYLGAPRSLHGPSLGLLWLCFRRSIDTCRCWVNRTNAVFVRSLVWVNCFVYFSFLDQLSFCLEFCMVTLLRLNYFCLKGFFSPKDGAWMFFERWTPLLDPKVCLGFWWIVLQMNVFWCFWKKRKKQSNNWLFACLLACLFACFLVCFQMGARRPRSES